MRYLAFVAALTLSVLGAEPPAIGLNHFYLAVSPDTYAAIAASEFLRTKFAAFEKRTTVRSDSTYTGAYFYGRHTYFEFFEAGVASGQNLGNSGIAWGTDTPGTIKALGAGCRVKPGEETITRGLDGKQIPWFYQCGPRDSRFEPLSTWLMEYRPEFLPQWHPEAGSAAGTTRDAVLERYRAVLKLPARRYLLEDVTSLTIEVSPDDRDNVEQFCRKLGFSRKNEPDAVVLEGVGIELHVLKSVAKPRGITEVRFRTTGIPSVREYKLGTSSLRFLDNHTAVWTF